MNCYVSGVSKFILNWCFVKKIWTKSRRKIIWELKQKFVIFIDNKNKIETKNDDEKKLQLKVERKFYKN